MKTHLILALAATTMAGLGCSSEGTGKKTSTKPVMAALRGKAAGRPNSAVVAKPIASKGAEVTKPPIRTALAADGSFTLSLPRGERYTLVLETDGVAVAAIGFPSRPGFTPSFVLNLSLEVTLVTSDFDFGVLTQGRAGFTPEFNPCEIWLDLDGDGLFDYFDDDDDGDGTLDLSDLDADGDGIDDDEMDGDLDEDGLIDLVDQDDDGDGVADTVDSDDDGVAGDDQPDDDQPDDETP